MYNDFSRRELEALLAAKLCELGMAEADIKYWVNHPEEMAECLEECIKLAKNRDEVKKWEKST